MDLLMIFVFLVHTAFMAAVTTWSLSLPGHLSLGLFSLGVTVMCGGVFVILVVSERSQ